MCKGTFVSTLLENFGMSKTTNLVHQQRIKSGLFHWVYLIWALVEVLLLGQNIVVVPWCRRFKWGEREWVAIKVSLKIEKLPFCLAVPNKYVAQGLSNIITKGKLHMQEKLTYLISIQQLVLSIPFARVLKQMWSGDLLLQKLAVIDLRFFRQIRVHSNKISCIFCPTVSH